MPGFAERCAGRVLAQLLPADVAEALIGDLLEERDLRARSAGPRHAALWYWSQLITSVPPLLGAAIRRREFALASAIGSVAYAVAAAAEDAALESVALVATHTAVDALPVLIIYLLAIVLMGYVAARVSAGAAAVLGVLVALAAVTQLVGNFYGMPLWYRWALPVIGPAAAVGGHALFVHRSRGGARRRKSIA